MSKVIPPSFFIFQIYIIFLQFLLTPKYTHLFLLQKINISPSTAFAFKIFYIH